MAGYTGGWLRNAYVDPSAANVPQAGGPEHAGKGAEDVYSYAYEAPPLTESGPIGEYPGTEWIAQTPGTVIDTTPDSHEGGSPDQDQGAARQGYYTVPNMTFADEKYTGVGFDGLPSTPVSPVALQRGLNSLPENNPDGFNPGHAQVNDFWVDRKFAVGERVHDRRVVTVNTAWEPTNVPAPQNGNVNTSPFDSLARPMTRVFQRPEVRREPPPVSDDLQVDATGQSQPDYYSGVSSWVVG